MAQGTPKKSGWFGGMFSAKPAHETIAAIARDLTISIGVTDQFQPILKFTGDSSTISKLEKALRNEGVNTSSHKPGSITLQGDAAVAPAVAVLNKVHNAAKAINFQKLKDRVSFDDMEGLTDRDMLVLRQQNNPTIDLVGSIIKLAVRDKKDAQNVKDAPANSETEAPKGNRAATAKVKPKPAAKAVIASKDDDLDFELNVDYTIKNRNGPGGGLVVALPPGTDDETWISEIRDLRLASGTSGLVSVQRYQNPKKPENKGYIINGLPADELVGADDTSVSKADLVRRIERAAAAEERFVATGTREKLKSATFNFPKGFAQERKEEFISQLREAFGDDGYKYVMEVPNLKEPEQSSFRIIGVTKAELAEGGGLPISNSVMLAKLNELSEKIRSETPLPDGPDTSKAVVFYFPKELPQERRDQYIDELRQLYADQGERTVRSYRSRNDIEKTGIKIMGATKQELLEPDQKSIGDRTLLKKLRAIMESAHAEVASANEQEPPAGTVALDPPAKDTGADILADLMKEVRGNIRDYEMKRNEIVKSKGREEAQAELEALAKNAPGVVSFPKDSKMIILHNLDKTPEEMQQLSQALQEAGYDGSAVIGVNNLYIALAPLKSESHAERITSEQDGPSPEEKLASLLEKGFRPGEVAQFVEKYQKRNPGHGMQVVGG